MHLSYRLIVLLGGAAAVSMGFATYQAIVDMDGLKKEVRRQAQLIAESQQKPVEQMVQSGSFHDLQIFEDRFQHHERLAGVAVYDGSGQAVAATGGLQSRIAAPPAAVRRTLQSGVNSEEFFLAGGNSFHRSEERRVGKEGRS